MKKNLKDLRKMLVNQVKQGQSILHSQNSVNKLNETSENDNISAIDQEFQNM